MHSQTSGQVDAPTARPADSERAPRLEGRMGVTELVLSVLAFSAPLTVVVAFAPFVIVFNGIGAPATYLAGTLLVLIFAVGFTTMTRYIPTPGAFYAYITAGLGRVAGLGAAFLATYGYLLLLVAVYPYFGVAANNLMVGTFGGPEIEWYWYTLLCLLGVAILGYLNVELSAKVLTLAMALEIIIIMVFDVAVFADGGPEGRSLEPFGWNAFTSGTVGIAVLFAVTSFLGFEATAIYREETKDPWRTIPRATYLAVIFIGVFYMVAAWLLIVALGVSDAAAAVTNDVEGAFFGAMSDYAGEIAVDIASVFLVTSFFAALLSIHNVGARYLYSLGFDGALPRALGRAHPRHRSPYRASVTVTGLVFLCGVPFVLAGSDPVLLYGRLAGTGGFVVVTLMLLTSVAVLVFFRRHSHSSGTTVWNSTVAPALAIVGMAVVVYLAITNFTTLIGGSTVHAILLLGLTCAVLIVGLLLALYYRSRSPDVYKRLGRQPI